MAHTAKLSVIKYDDYQQLGEVANDNLDRGDLSRKQAIFYETQKLRAQMLKVAYDDTGLKFEVPANDNTLPKDAVAYAIISEDRVGVVENLLVPGKKRLLLHAARHEKGHIESGIEEIDLKEVMQPDQIAAVERKLGIKDLAGIDIVEGLNETRTFLRYGEVKESGYRDVEVPVAKKLERLAQEKLGVSFLELFGSGQKQLLNLRLRQLADFILFEETVEKMEAEKIRQKIDTDKPVYAIRDAVKLEVKKRIHAAMPHLRDAEDAERKAWETANALFGYKTAA